MVTSQSQSQSVEHRILYTAGTGRDTSNKRERGMDDRVTTARKGIRMVSDNMMEDAGEA